MKFSLSDSTVAALVIASGLLLTLLGCGSATSTSSGPKTSTPVPTAEAQVETSKPAAASVPAVQASALSLVGKAAETEGEHAHQPGSHGGIIIPIGMDSYHTEAIVEKGGDFRLLMLGKDESRIQEVEVQPLKAYVKAIGQPDATPVELTATPMDGDAQGKTSQFVGKLPEELRGKPLEVTIPNIRINGERFRVGFSTATETHAEEMPASLPADEEQTLYLTAQGKYTVADIEANGRVTASQKFKGMLSKHDMRPKSGDRICPITLTKANSAFAWIVDGQSYQFCCPPCVDEFVMMAKETPEQIQLPESYVK